MAKQDNKGRIGINTAVRAAMSATDREALRKKIEAMTPNERAARLTSVRAYRRQIDVALVQAMQGKLSPGTLKEIVAAAREGAALLMSEKLLEAKSIKDVEPVHEAGPDGGAKLPEYIPEYQSVKVERTTGIGPTGEPIDTTVVTVEGGPELARKVAALDVGAAVDRHVPEALPEQPKESMTAKLTRESTMGSGGTAVAPSDHTADPGEVEFAVEAVDDED